MTENNVLNLQFPSHIRSDGVPVLTSKLDPLLYKYYCDADAAYRLQYDNAQKILQDNQLLIARINTLNSEKSLLEADRNKWKGWCRFIAFLASVQVFLYFALRHWV